MTIGKRIKELRKQAGYSQEYLAEQLNISRQAISKWEQDITSPDTHNLIQLAALLNTSVEYLACGKEINLQMAEKKVKSSKFTPKQKKIIAMLFSISIVLIGCFSVVMYIYSRPVEWDAGACGGGYATYIFDKYCEDLTERCLNGMGVEKEKVISLRAIRGSQSAEWAGRTIHLQFEIEYEHEDHGLITETVRFVASRYWIEAFQWKVGPIIVG